MKTFFNLTKKTYLVKVIVFCMLYLVSCTKETDVPKNSDSEFQNPVSYRVDETVLGNQLPNPYLLPNMIAAYQVYTGNSTATLNATHEYVRFKAEDNDEMQRLSESDLELFDYPLDYEIIFEGDYYHDPEIPDEEYTWLYTAVPVGYAYDPDIYYEKLADLYLPDETVAGEALEDIAFTLVNYDDNNPNDKVQANRYKPEGYINVLDYIDRINQSNNRYVPAQHVKVRARRWFKWDTKETDESGYFKMTKKFRKKCRVTLIFKTQKCAIRDIKRIFPAMHKLFFPADNALGKFTGSSMESINANLSYHSKVGMWATINNSVENFHDYCLQTDLGLPPDGLLIYADEGVGGQKRAAAPMLKQIGTTSFLVDILNIVFAFNGNPVSAAIVNIITINLPDITLNWENGAYPFQYSQDAVQTMMHEMAHASHYDALNNNYWTDFMGKTIAVGSQPCYGASDDPGSQMIGLFEGWAEYIGCYFAFLQYGTSFNGMEIQESHYDNVEQNHMTFPEYLDESNKNNEYNICPESPWIPVGFFNDLNDHTNLSDDPLEPIYDHVHYYSIGEMFSTLSLGIDRFDTFYQTFRGNYVSSSDEPDYDLLYSWYQY
jgi:hypothetical protein